MQVTASTASAASAKTCARNKGEREGFYWWQGLFASPAPERAARGQTVAVLLLLLLPVLCGSPACAP
jgi:hypothetical protein